MPEFLSVTNAVLQWVLNTAGCDVKIRYANVLHTKMQETADEHKFR